MSVHVETMEDRSKQIACCYLIIMGAIAIIVFKGNFINSQFFIIAVIILIIAAVIGWHNW